MGTTTGIDRRFDGMSFALQPRSRKELEQEFSDAEFATFSVFIRYDTAEAFEEYGLETIEEQVIHLLTGLSPGRVLEKFDAIRFQVAASDEVLRRVGG